MNIIFHLFLKGNDVEILTNSIEIIANLSKNINLNSYSFADIFVKKITILLKSENNDNVEASLLSLKSLVVY